VGKRIGCGATYLGVRGKTLNVSMPMLNKWLHLERDGLTPSDEM
jgi:hypothetical protein